MDPQATLVEALSAIMALREDATDSFARDGCVVYLRSLAGWLDNGGYAPKVDFNGRLYRVELP